MHPAREQYRFNVLNYGADNRGVISASAAIQRAVDDANAWSLAHDGMGATVYVPEGYYLITAGIQLRSYIHVLCEHGVNFYAANGYAGSFWYHDGTTILIRCKVSGGYYRALGAGNTYTGIDLRSTDAAAYAYFCEFSDMYFYYPNVAINLNVTLTGALNGNIFKDIIVWRPIIGVSFARAVGGWITGNVFDNIQIQSLNPPTTYGFYNVTGAFNNFVNCRVWDVALPTIGLEYTAGATNNNIIGGRVGLLGTTLVNTAGAGNLFLPRNDDGHILLPFSARIGWNNDQCFILHSGAVLTVTAPYGFGLEAGTPAFYTPLNTGNIVAATGITIDMQNRIMVYNGNAAIDITANPQIANASKDGTIITIVGSSDVNTLTLDDGTGLALAGGAAMVLGQYDSITLAFVSALSIWVELSRSNN